MENSLENLLQTLKISNDTIWFCQRYKLISTLYIIILYKNI